jgi:hydroxyacylglutathione hydrolase
MILETVVVGPFGVNSYIVGCEQTLKAAVIDPGDEEISILSKVDKLGLIVDVILITHAHIDHISAVSAIKKRTNASVYMHGGDQHLLEIAPFQAELFGLSHPQPFSIDFYVEDRASIEVGQLTFTVLTTPGHTPGSVCFVVADGVFTGDTLFFESIGRTDLPGGSIDQLMTSIKNKLLTMPKSTPVYPGHGEPTSIGHEIDYNTFIS